MLILLTLKVLITTAADHILFFYFHFSEKMKLDFSCESSAQQMVHMKCQALFSLKTISNKMK